MCGNATFTMVVSSTWISVADMTAKVISRRSLPVGRSRSSPSAVAGGRGELLIRRHGHEDAAAHALEQRGLLRLAPPARERPARLVPDDDEVRPHLLGRLADAV